MSARGHVELEDQLSGLERGHAAVVLGRKPVEVGDRKLARRRSHRRSERDQRRRHVGRMRRRAVAVPEDRVLAVLAGTGVAGVPAVQAARELEAPVPAASRLQEVAADRAHVAELRARREPARLAERIRDLRVGLELAQGRAGTDSRPVDPPRDDLADVDERLGFEQPVSEHRHHLGPAAQDHAVARDRLLEARRLQELHGPPSRALSPRAGRGASPRG